MPKIAVIQAGTYLLDAERTLEQMRSLAKEAATKVAELVVFPEAYIGGYPKGLDFGASVGIRTESGRNLFAEYASQAIVLNDKTCKTIAGMAKELQLIIVTGAIEKVSGTLYCSALTFTETGELIGHRRRLIPTAAEHNIWGQGNGSRTRLKKHNKPLHLVAKLSNLLKRLIMRH